MQIEVLEQAFTVCQPSDPSATVLPGGVVFFAQTDEETSLVCQSAFAPAQTRAREDGWRAFRVRGALDFALVGVLASLSSLLAAQNISIFAVSTYRTDYIFVKEESLDRALSALADAGYSILK